uniref:Uncharacterized protein n=1 Tax=Magallana gigas TaxID=29159 RepID=A0A8W8LM49_MAGGI
MEFQAAFHRKWRRSGAVVRSAENRWRGCRTVQQLKAERNVHQTTYSSKGKLSKIKRPKTGGGPKPVSPSASEKAMLKNLEGMSSLDGLSGGIDTSAISDTSKSSRKRKMNIQELEIENLRLDNTGKH